MTQLHSCMLNSSRLCERSSLTLICCTCRAIVGTALGNVSQPAPIQLDVKPFPWPSYTIDPAAGLAAAIFNLLIVFAFLAPARSIVVAIVREKELRLREGMRILGLTVRCSCACHTLARAWQSRLSQEWAKPQKLA